jgi:hypothetical protein
MGTLSLIKNVPLQNIFTFEENKLARRMIGSMQMKCKEEGCGYKISLGEYKSHWNKCEYRLYDCVHCEEIIRGKE